MKEKILDINDNIVKNPDLSKGYIKDEEKIIRHEALPYIQKISHYNVIKTYPNGGKDVEEVIDIPEQLAKEPWDETIIIHRYIAYTLEELEEIETRKNEPTQVDEIQAQVTYTAMCTDSLISLNQPLLAAETEGQKDYRRELVDNIRKWLKQKLWTIGMVEEAFNKGILTNEELASLAK